MIVICISNKVHKKYLDLLKSSNTQDVVVEEILTDLPITLNEDSENVYTLHKKFIKGYFNYRDNKIVKNPNFDPYYDSDVFKENIEKLNDK